MNMYTRYGAMLASLTLVLGVVACEGNTGPRGPAGLLGQGPVFDKAPKPDQDLGEYDSDPANTGDQTFSGQLAGSTGVWRITLDHALQFDRGTGEPPVIVDRVLYDTDHQVIWLTIDGVDMPLEDVSVGEQESFGCLVGVAEPCVKLTGTTFFPADAPPALLYANITQVDLDFGPAMDSSATIVVGVKTAIADMPVTGTATYIGASYFSGPYTDANGDPRTVDQIGTVNIDVTFDAATDQVKWSSQKTVDPLDLTFDEHLLSASATIDGNSYSGDLSGTITGANLGGDVLAEQTLVVGGTLEGSFYGPAPDTSNLAGDNETAGLFTWADADPTDADLDGDGSGDSAVGGGGGEFVGGQGDLPPPED